MPFDPEAIDDSWFGEDAPACHVAVTSRVRLARNLAGFPFAPHAGPEAMAAVRVRVEEAVADLEEFAGWKLHEIEELDASARALLGEARLISKELERNPGGAVLIAPDCRASLLVNEEDHIRLQAMGPGRQAAEMARRALDLDRALGRKLAFAWSGKYGYLTACPTNVGTGMRASVMLHLPALELLQEIEASLAGLAHYGLTVRGYYGEHSEHLGDFYQVSNEVTLGRATAQIVETLEDVVGRVIEKEEEARITLFEHHATTADDNIWRSFALLSHARKMDSAEAMRLLSRLRLGIDRGYFDGLSHADLNRLMVEIQPAHLERLRAAWGGAANRDEARAGHIRRLLAHGGAE